jgi:hypothetical protein
VRPLSRIVPAPAADAEEVLALDRRQRDVLQQLVVDLELGDWAARGFELDAADPDEQQARRERVESAFAILDDLGWHRDDERGHYVIRRHEALERALLQWREWQIAAIEDIYCDRLSGVPVSETAPALLVAAERLGVVAGLLQRLDGRA